MAERLEVSDWQSIDTIPIDRPVIVKTATGIEYLARARSPQIHWVQVPGEGKQKRVSCRRVDREKNSDVSAIAWHEPD